MQWQPEHRCAFSTSYTRIVRTRVDCCRVTATPPYIGGVPSPCAAAPEDSVRCGSNAGGVFDPVADANLLKILGFNDGADEPTGSSGSSSICSPVMSCGQLKRFRRKLHVSHHQHDAIHTA